MDDPNERQANLRTNKGENSDEDEAHESHEDNDDEMQYENNLRPISAKAPKVKIQDEVQIEVNSTPAFQCLEELFQNGKLTGTQVAQLKAKYIELHERLKMSQENEQKLLKDTKEYLRKLDENKEIIEKLEGFPDNLTNLSSQVLNLRAQLLKKINEFNCFEEREYDFNYKRAGLEEDKKLLEREYARMPKAHELEKKIQELDTQNGDLSREISRRQEEIQEIVQSIAIKQKENEQKQKDLKMILDELEDRKSEFIQVSSEPGMYMKEADKISMENDEVIKEKHRVETEYKDLYKKYSEMEVYRQELEDKKAELSSSINKLVNQSLLKEKDNNELMKVLELEREKESVLIADKATLEHSLRHVLVEKKSEYELFLRAQKDKERDFKQCKKLEMQLKAAQDSFSNLKLAYEKVLGKKEQQPSDDGSLFQRRKELNKEVEQLKKNLTQQQGRTQIEKTRVENFIESEEHLLCEQSDYRVEAVEVTRLAAIKLDEKEQKAREHLKAQTRFKRALEDLKTKDIIIEDNRKKYREIKFKIKEHAKMYNIIKNERNKCVNKIQICTQRAAEMREKIKILQNEIEILRTSLTQKEKRLQKQHLKYTNLIVIRDSTRNETAKQKKILQEHMDMREQQKMNINNYNNLSVNNEQELVKMRKKYDEAVKSRNERGIELMTRSEEVCVILERSNVQETMLNNANLELAAKEEELRFLRLQYEEELRQLKLFKKELPNKTALDEELEVLQKQLEQCQNRVAELEAKAQDCNDPERINFLEGREEKPEEIMKKLEEIEIKLAAKEEHCLEKDLILEQVCRLTDRISNKVDVSKEDTLDLAKNVNEIQNRIKDVTRKMMATVSELSMAQAQALSLQEEVKTKELELEQSYIRMEKGEPPSEEIEREWMKMIVTEEKRKHEKLMQQSHDDNLKQFTLPTGIVTTAEPRPNAYIPQDGSSELPIPKPYGKAAPFKPSEQGSTMRHVRKPNPKPIEI